MQGCAQCAYLSAGWDGAPALEGKGEARLEGWSRCDGRWKRRDWLEVLQAWEILQAYSFLVRTHAQLPLPAVLWLPRLLRLLLLLL